MNVEMKKVLQELDTSCFETLLELHKAKHMSERVLDFFDQRDPEKLSDIEKLEILKTMPAAAIDHDIVHDYLLRSISTMQKLSTQLDMLWSQQTR